MSEFKNRVSSTLNHKILDVKSVERDESGEIISMEVEVIRNDEVGLTKEGTPLNAESLNEVINEMINSRVKEAIKNYHFNDLATLENAEATVLVDGSCAMFDYIYIDTDEAVNIYVENEFTQYFNVNCPNASTAGTITVEIQAIQDPDLTEVSEFDFIVKLYSQEHGEMIKKVTCTVAYQTPSQTPED